MNINTVLRTQVKISSIHHLKKKKSTLHQSEPPREPRAGAPLTFADALLARVAVDALALPMRL